MGTLFKIIRILLGVFLLAQGLNKLPQIPNFMPAFDMPQEAQELLGCFFGSYVLELVTFVELFTGFLLIIGWWVPLALVILAPLSVNIVAFHITTSPAAGIPAYIVAGLNLIFILMHRISYEGLLKR